MQHGLSFFGGFFRFSFLFFYFFVPYLRAPRSPLQRTPHYRRHRIRFLEKNNDFLYGITSLRELRYRWTKFFLKFFSPGWKKYAKENDFDFVSGYILINYVTDRKGEPFSTVIPLREGCEILYELCLFRLRRYSKNFRFADWRLKGMPDFWPSIRKWIRQSWRREISELIVRTRWRDCGKSRGWAPSKRTNEGSVGSAKRQLCVLLPLEK